MNLHNELLKLNIPDYMEVLYSEELQSGEKTVQELEIHAKLFNPTGRGTWYVAACDPEQRIAFGYASIFGDYNDEWGDFAIEELQDFIDPRFQLGIEVDLHFNKCLGRDIETKIA